MFCNLHLKISVKCQRGEGDHNKPNQILELFFNNSQIFPQITPDLLEVIENVFFGPNDDFRLVKTFKVCSFTATRYINHVSLAAFRHSSLVSSSGVI